MADIRHTMSLDDSRFAQGLRHAEGLAERNAKAMETGFGRLGKSFDGAFKFAVLDQAFKRSFGIAQNAVNAYASEFTFARQELERFQGAFHDFNLSLGRDLFNVVSGPGGGWVDSLVSGADQLRQMAANKVSDLFTLEGGHGAAVDEARREQEALDKRIASMQKVRDLQAELSGELATSEGRTGDAARIAEKERHRRRLVEIGGMGLPGGSSELESLTTLEKSRHEAELQHIQEREDKEKQMEADRAAASERRKADAVHELDVDSQRLGIQQMRLSGMGKEADLKELQLQFDEKRRAIEQSDALTQDQKQAALDDLWNRQNGIEYAMKNQEITQRPTLGFTGSDVSDARVRALILGPGAAKPTDAVAKNTKETADHGKKSVSLLDRIERNTRGKTAGVFG